LNPQPVDCTRCKNDALRPNYAAPRSIALMLPTQPDRKPVTCAMLTTESY